MHPVAVDGHRHAVGRVGHADRLPRGEAHAHRLPAPREPADVVGVDVHGEVRLGDEAMHLDGVTVLGASRRGRRSARGPRRRGRGAASPNSATSVVQKPRQLGGPEHAVQGIGADEGRPGRTPASSSSRTARIATPRIGPNDPVVWSSKAMVTVGGLTRSRMRGSPSGAASAARTAPSRSVSGGSTPSASLDSRRVAAGSAAVNVPSP